MAKQERINVQMSISLKQELASMSSTGSAGVEQQFADILTRASAPTQITVSAESAKDVLGKCNVLGTVSAVLTCRPSRDRAKKTSASTKARGKSTKRSKSGK